jgi:hypothetical protein
VQKSHWKFPPPSQLVPGLPAEADQLVAAALSPEPSARPAGPQEFTRLLRAAMASQQKRGDTPPARSATAR